MLTMTLVSARVRCVSCSWTDAITAGVSPDLADWVRTIAATHTNETGHVTKAWLHYEITP